jgi:hypothetical protein
VNMTLLRLRFTVRRLMVAVAVVAFLVVALHAMTNVIADGGRAVTVDILVLDNSDRPIPAATIRMSEYGFSTPRSASASVQQSVTSSDGRASFPGYLRIAYHGSILRGRYFVSNAPRSFRIEAAGYEPREMEIGDQPLDPDYHRQGTIPPPIAVHLSVVPDPPAPE